MYIDRERVMIYGLDAHVICIRVYIYIYIYSFVYMYMFHNLAVHNVA